MKRGKTENQQLPGILPNIGSLFGYHTKVDERRQGMRGGHKYGKMGQRRLWMVPNPNEVWFKRPRKLPLGLNDLGKC